MIPPRFDEQFLVWFRDQTEAAWHDYKTATLEDYRAAGVGGSDWQRGTHWLGGLSQQEIAEIEQRWAVRFPPDYRLFLSILHSLDTPFSRARYDDSGNLTMISSPSFYNWQTESAAIEQAYAQVVDGMLFDVQHNIWYQSWGKKPNTEEAQKARVRKLVAAAPRLVPIIGHRFLLAEPWQEGNPVLSIHQTDIIIYAPNLYYYFLKEFSYLLNVAEEELELQLREGRRVALEQHKYYKKTIPFWGAFL